MSHACIGFSGGASGKKCAYQCRRCKRLEFEPWGAWNPLQYSCLWNTMDRGAWWVTVHGVAKSRTWLKQFRTAAAAAAKLLQSCLTLRPHRVQPTSLPRPWDSPGKNTGVGCHFLLQCRKVKSESKVAQSCPTLRDPVDCSLPGSSVHGIFQARVLEWGAIAFSAT